MPVLIGWAAHSGKLSLTAWLFFLVVFFWTPPHFWALAIKYKDDYSAAGIPMLPVVAPSGSVKKQTWFHSIFMVLTSLLTVWSAKLHWTIAVITFLIGLQFFRQVKELDSPDSSKAAARLFQWSITYLSVFSLALVVGALI